MPQVARIVFAGLPHHITRRGNRRSDVFFENADRAEYLEILAYCPSIADKGGRGICGRGAFSPARSMMSTCGSVRCTANERRAA